MIQETESSGFHETAVNVSSYLNDLATMDERRATANILWDQLRQSGFCYVSGTGISKSLCRSALNATREFLHDADETVRRSCLTKDRARRGYSPMCTENFASLVGDEAPNDLVRKYRIGPLHGRGESALLAPNVWPQWNQSQKFQSALQNYYQVANHTAQAVVRAISDAMLVHHPELKNSISVFQNPNVVANTSILTLLGYRVGSRHKRKPQTPLIAPHTDVGVITMLLFDNGGCATLQRADDDSWVNVRLPSDVGEDDPVFVVNIGDCLSELSDGFLPSTLHQVVPTQEGDPRSCLALFVGLDPDQELMLPLGEKLRYEEWRKRRIARAQNVLKSMKAKKIKLLVMSTS